MTNVSQTGRNFQIDDETIRFFDTTISRRPTRTPSALSRISYASYIAQGAPCGNEDVRLTIWEVYCLAKAAHGDTIGMIVISPETAAELCRKGSFPANRLGISTESADHIDIPDINIRPSQELLDTGTGPVWGRCEADSAPVYLTIRVVRNPSTPVAAATRDGSVI